MFARVALPTAVPEALTYSVPPPLAELAEPGVRVRVRLRGRSRVGLLVERTAEPGCPPDRVLPLEEVLDPAPLLPEHVLDLVRFAAGYYASPLGMVVRAAVPGQLLRVPPDMVAAGDRARELLASASALERRLLERLLAARRLTVSRLRTEGWTREELDLVLPALAGRHGVRVLERPVPAAAGRVVSGVALAPLEEAEADRRVGRAPAQARVVASLRGAGGPILEGELLVRCGCSPGVVAELVRKGVVRRFQQVRQPVLRRWELTPPPRPRALTAAQQAVVAALGEGVAGGGFRATLLVGVTGSGKTEVYLQLAERAVAAGRQVLMLVPEIGLTPALAGQLSARFGERVAVVHSSMADGERFAAWERARRGQVDVVAGPRSAVWAPLARPGLVVVDEEQDGSYKQDEDPRYNARDLALVLGQRLAVPVVLGSATPSLEALWLADQGKLERFELPERVAGGRLPDVEVVDLREEEPEPGEHGQRWLSRRVRELLAGTLERGEQAILLVNRRGWAPVLLCRECGHQASCRDCSIPMTVHRRRQVLACHYCGHSRPIPDRCPHCGGEVLHLVGAGTEKIADKVRALLPDARVAILDRDTARSPAQLLATLEGFTAGDSDVLVGTQMVSKGHHFPRVTLTAVINADTLLGFPDFRGAEKTFQMLTQVAGRAGRGERPGIVVIQSYHPDHHAVRAALNHDLAGFTREELRYRRAFRYPPVARMALVRFESPRETAAVAAGREAAATLAPLANSVRVIGPAPAPIARLRGRWRVHLMVLAATRPPLREALARVTDLAVPRSVRRIVDVDPQSTV